MRTDSGLLLPAHLRNRWAPEAVGNESFPCTSHALSEAKELNAVGLRVSGTLETLPWFLVPRLSQEYAGNPQSRSMGEGWPVTPEAAPT